MPEPGRILGLITARGGSKRLPRKNVLPLHGKPLIEWTISAALRSGVLDDVLVSTDDEEIADVSRHAGAAVPWLRPAELADDATGSAAVIQHAVRWYEAQHGPAEAVVLLQPTSPFRRAESIRQAVHAFRRQPRGHACAIVSVSPAPAHPAWCFTIENDELRPFLGWEAMQTRSQDLTPAYALNGAIYVLAASLAREGAPLVQAGTRPFLMDDPTEALDVDTPEDWRAAQQLAARHNGMPA